MRSDPWQRPPGPPTKPILAVDWGGVKNGSTPPIRYPLSIAGLRDILFAAGLYKDGFQGKGPKIFIVHVCLLPVLRVVKGRIALNRLRSPSPLKSPNFRR